MTDDAPDNTVSIRLTFPSPDGVAVIATGLAHAGFPDVKLYLVVEATATEDDADLRLLHDRVKELGPMIEQAHGGQISRVTRDGWTQAPAGVDGDLFDR